MKALLTLLFVLGLALPAHAEPLKLASVTFFAAGMGADLGSTTAVLRGGGHESNPLLGQSLGRIVGTKLALNGGFLLWAHYLDTHQHSRAASVLRCAGGTLSFGAAVHNLKVVR